MGLNLVESWGYYLDNAVKVLSGIEHRAVLAIGIV